MNWIYFDFNASTPVAPEVAAIIRHALETGHGNPSSSHWAGVPARRMVEDARTQVAGLLGCAPQEIVFTSGGSEANNHALKGVFFASDKERPHFITSSAEHPAIVAPLRFLERLGARVTWLPVDGAGLVGPDDLRRAMTDDTVLVTIMHANNETGTIQPIAECAAIAREHGVRFGRHDRRRAPPGESRGCRDRSGGRGCWRPSIPRRALRSRRVGRHALLCRRSAPYDPGNGPRPEARRPVDPR